MDAPPVQPSALEMQILSVLWDHGPSTVRAVLESLPDQKKRAYTTILSTMQVMEKKGLVRRGGMVSGALLYEAEISREQVSRPVLRQLLGTLFGGRPSAVLQSLLADTPVDEEELAEIRRILDAQKGGKGKKSSGKGSGR